MKTNFLIVFVLCLLQFTTCFSQEKDAKEKRKNRKSKQEKVENAKPDTDQKNILATKEPVVAISSDIKFASSSNDSRKESNSGTGSLGLKFEQGIMFGNVNFTVYSKSDSIYTGNKDEVKVFGTNLLNPLNNNGSISNFNIEIGLKNSFDCNGTGFLSRLNNSFKGRVGVATNFSINNNLWIKDSISTPITITSTTTYLFINIIDTKIKETNEDIKLKVAAGFSTRRLGGDYGIKQNEELRNYFIGTSERGFEGFSFIARLEVSKFFGQVNLTSFDRKGNILGFSSNQSLITVGLNADLKIPVGKSK